MDDFVDEYDETKLINKFVKENYDTFSKMLNEYIMHTLDSYDERVKSRVLIKCMSFYKEICKQSELLLINNKKNAKLNSNAITIEN
jgi:Ni,Fe-hydrogenase III component G